MSSNGNKIELPGSVVIRDLAQKVGKSPIDLIKKLMSNGVMATINQSVDFDTAAIVVAEYGFEAIPEVIEDDVVETGEVPLWRQAIAEERARSPLAEAQRESDAMLADPTISAARVLTGSPAELLGRLEALLSRDESLGVIRRYPDRIVLEPRRGLMDQLTRSMDFGGKGYYLSRASEVVVSVGAVDARRDPLAAHDGERVR